MRPSGIIQGGPKSNKCHSNRQRRGPRKGGGREWRDVATGQGMPGAPEAGRGGKDPPPLSHLNFGLWSPDCEEQMSVLLSSRFVVLRCGSLGTRQGQRK